jgi:hypothetical protein
LLISLENHMRHINQLGERGYLDIIKIIFTIGRSNLIVLVYGVYIKRGVRRLLIKKLDRKLYRDRNRVIIFVRCLSVMVRGAIARYSITQMQLN